MTSLDELIATIFQHNLQRYSGGRDGKDSVILDNPHSNTCFELDFSSKDECRIVEEAIQPYMTIFHPRLFQGDVAHV